MRFTDKQTLMVRHLPNVLTCCNLLCGVFGIVYVFEGGNAIPVAAFVWISLLFDFLDGFSARLLKVNSAVGKELDSLADVVSFGLLPSAFIYTLIKANSSSPYLPYIAFIIAVFSALRLARFNVDDSQSNSFRGLPTPANALFLTGLPFLSRLHIGFIHDAVFLILVSLVFSSLLVSRIELFALKFKDFSWRNNKIQFTFLFFSVLLFVSLKFAAIPLIILFYILLSLSGVVASGQRVH